MSQPPQQPPIYVAPPNRFPMDQAQAQPTQNGGVHGIDKASGERFKIAFLAACGFALLAHPVVFRVVNHVFAAFTQEQNEIITEWGNPTTKGMIVHALVFFGFMLFLMYRS